MPTVEITRPTTVRELLFDEQGDAEIAVHLAARLPPHAWVGEQPSRQRRLPKSAYRLLNSRIAALAVEFLDHDVAVDGWSYPLITRRLMVPVRLALHPPVAIPLGPSVPSVRSPSGHR
jgi:hypothetical protein